MELNLTTGSGQKLRLSTEPPNLMRWKMRATGLEIVERMGMVDGDATRAWLRLKGEKVLPRDLRRARAFADDWFLQATSDEGNAFSVSCAREILEAELACAFRAHRRDYLQARREARKRTTSSPVEGSS